MNFRRVDNGLQSLKVITVPLESDPSVARQKEMATDAALEDKVSSSNFRKKLLGEFP